MINVIGILQAVADEVRALTDDGLADFAGPLARNNERKSELATFLRNSLISQSCQTAFNIYHLSASKFFHFIGLFRTI
ncbi:MULTISPECIES: hypothetical protein, partial [unclassified Undibacterium]|uniref:hypothetical protein n=1 Tax=unclassified Undibacterium TaxID=2630295 RepID=UPI002B22E817